MLDHLRDAATETALDVESGHFLILDCAVEQGRNRLVSSAPFCRAIEATPSICAT